MAFCPKCGNKVNDGDQFCVKCGNRLEYTKEKGIEEKKSNAEPSAKRKKAPLLIAIIALLICAGIAAGFFLYKARNIDFSDDPTAIEQASKSVVLLECYDKNGDLYCTGSAFAAFEEGVFVTNFHVVEQEVYRILARTENGTMFEMDSVLAADSQHDIAILRTKASPNIAPLPIGSSAGLEKGEKIVAIGSPLGLLNTVSTGVFSGYNDTGARNEIQFSASISHGSSGGALFNNAGEVIGITTASYTEGQNLNVAVPIQYAADIKNAQSTEMTIAQFYETFDHYNEYTVSDLLRNRDLKEDHAYVYGYVAAIKEDAIVLVSDQAQIAEYQSLYSNYSTVTQSFNGNWAEAIGNLNDFETKNTVLVREVSSRNGEVSISKKIEFQGNVGDAVCVIAFIRPNEQDACVIFIQNKECISILSK